MKVLTRVTSYVNYVVRRIVTDTICFFKSHDYEIVDWCCKDYKCHESLSHIEELNSRTKCCDYVMLECKRCMKSIIVK